MKTAIMGLLVLILATSCTAQPGKWQVVDKRFQSAANMQGSVCTLTVTNGNEIKTVRMPGKEYYYIGIGNWIVLD